ncbi:carboxylate-amine ligase [Plasticicumulans sp.]|uniref:carboxylate-amine ligase n=2 Tax=Plasticicumulans sp. TaxID=2307179 RepID=UPI002B59FFAC|nr:carboxylate-amine ligase [Plasticicumulans sp.]MBS0601774.1 carboxylate-amine ligase [Pseudomonadota bacterium]HNF64351.1 carboxylate-amine ligase [Plasticicumulans sp.]HNG48274.1 carboxylate-amine ligase [Plasticicumulans sp.]HNJ06533.1 carboxylate-amine ligase [Plasticicumulans sp.]HNM42644.1 carboxylate-amine ligase [Plasticicumulans sp.]
MPGGPQPPFTLGIEEEYFLVERASRDLARELPPGLLDACNRRLGDRVTPEFLRGQIEVGTRTCTSLAEARADLAELRTTLAEVAAQHGCAPIAASTHPFARWHDQQPTDRARYRAIAEDLQGVGRRLLICGMHVHVGLPDDDLRIDLMGQFAYFLPHLLALSTSSPFWRGEDTGLCSYRVSVFNEMPRTGLPPAFASWGEYARHVRVLVGAGLIEDATKLWWDLRPSARFPTLEMRITDVCPRLDDALALAALTRCLLRRLWRLRRDNQRWRVYKRMLIDENRWRAQRYGLAEGLVDFGRGCIVPFPELLAELQALVAEDAAHFGCEAEIRHLGTILERGTGADRQRAVRLAALERGAAPLAAMQAVVDDLIVQTQVTG